MCRSTVVAALIAAIAGLAASTGLAQAATFICVPGAAGAAVTSGGPSGSCSAGTAVELPASRADQQSLLSVLPYLSFKASGVGGKPTITVTGANLQVARRADTAATTADGTGNLVVGRANNPYNRERTGSENLVVGDAHGWSGQNALLAGFHNQARGFYNVAFGQDGLVSGDSASVLGGYGNTASGTRSTVAGGANKTAASANELIADGASNVHWAKLDGTGRLLSSSDRDTQNYSSAYYAIVRFPSVDLSKCSVSVQALGGADEPPASVPYVDWAGFIYVRPHRPDGQRASGIPMDIIATC